VYDVVRKADSGSSDEEDDDEQMGRILSFPFESIGIFVYHGKGGTVYYDAAPLYEAAWIRTAGDMSIEKIHQKWKDNYERWGLKNSKMKRLPFVKLNDFYPIYHGFIRASVSPRFI
jgi:hypothetical protein